MMQTFENLTIIKCMLKLVTLRFFQLALYLNDFLGMFL